MEWLIVFFVLLVIGEISNKTKEIPISNKTKETPQEDLTTNEILAEHNEKIAKIKERIRLRRLEKHIEEEHSKQEIYEQAGFKEQAAHEKTNGSNHDNANGTKTQSFKNKQVIDNKKITQEISQIRSISEQRQVPFLVHFTRAENLRSIIKNGIYPRSRINEVCITPKTNDSLRLDGRTNGTSLSLAFPNSKMLYKYRMENQESEWVILVLEPSILWDNNCAFCNHNAADARISKQPIELLKTSQSFAKMFIEIQGEASRAEQNLRSFDPTDVQAEVLVFDVIEPQLIVGVVFDSNSTKERYVGVVGNRRTWTDANNKHLFASRNYVRKFSSVNSIEQERAVYG